MRRLNYIILIIVVSTITVYAQNKIITRNNKLDTRVFGYAVHNGQTFLATDNGFILVDNNKNINQNWQAYYREVYEDSTISNPNTIIGEQKSQFPVQFFIPIDIEKWASKQYSFTKQLYLYDFIQVDSTGNYSYKQGVLGILGNLKKKNGLNFPKAK